jgi:[acyl-carrier-protein] S-malonyltransferase
VGEISALFAAGVLSFENALRLVTKRAEIMATISTDGAMTSVVGLGRADVEFACTQGAAEGVVCVGLHNGPQHFVLSGATPAVERAGAVCRELGAIKVSRLHTQHAFHSPLMQPVVAAWAEYVATVELAPPRLPVALNTTGDIARDVDDIRQAIIDQVAHTVRWCEIVQSFVARDVRVFVEASDTKVLGALTRAVEPEATTITLADSRAEQRLRALAGGSNVAVS